MANRKVILKDDKIQLQLGGMTGFLAVKRSMSIPYEDIHSVSTELPEAVKMSFKVAGVQMGDRHEGTFKSSGNHVFLTYNDPNKVVVLEMDGFSTKGMMFEYIYDYIVFEVDNPEEMKAEIEQRISKYVK